MNPAINSNVQAQILATLGYALAANLTFSISSVWFTDVSRKVSPIWMNTFKALVAFFLSLVTLMILQVPLVATWPIFLMCGLSGFIGLCVGDLFMLKAMKEIGGARMLMIFSLTPFLTGLGSFFLFQSTLHMTIWIGVLFMILCLCFLSLEKFKTSGHWQIMGIALGLLAVFLDACGLLITKYAFTEITTLHPFELHLYRCTGALIGFVLYDQFIERIRFIDLFKKASREIKIKAFSSSALGTFLSLFFYLKAISMGHLSIVSSLAAVGPLITQIYESSRERKWPKIYFWLAFVCMVIGANLITRSIH